MVTLKTNLGDIVIELDAQHAPNTVENFLSYAKNGFYDGTVFHRVIDGFMIQGGGFDKNMQQKPTHAPIRHEGKRDGMKNARGTIAMARTSDPHSATAQFFINVVDNDFLNFTSETDSGWGYCVFGKVTEGMDIVDKIKATPTQNHSGHQNVPKTPVVIEKVIINETANMD
jgi:peptidyl-prolyl cis-trans isomerase B (cyclophilin B)